MKRKTEGPKVREVLKVLLKIVLIIIFLYLLLVGAANLAAGDASKQLPAMANLRKYGCSVNGPVLTINHNDPAGREHAVWEVHCWVAHQTPYETKATKDWKLWLGHYKSLEDGNKACMKWMKRIKKASARWKMENRKRTLR